MQKVIFMKKAIAQSICGSLTSTSKMPCKSYSLPTEACKTGFEMAKIDGSVCSICYADRGAYLAYANNIKPAQFARLDSISDPLWVDGMVSLIGDDPFFRWHDSGDIQGVDHLWKIVQVVKLTPKTRHWLPTREYGFVKAYLSEHGDFPSNLIVRLSAMYIDKPVIVPKSLQGKKQIAISNVHISKPIGEACKAPLQGNSCQDCRDCWTTKTISYQLH